MKMPAKDSLSSHQDDVKVKRGLINEILSPAQQKIENLIDEIKLGSKKAFSIKKDSRMSVHGWYFSTLIAGLIPAVIGCILWTTLSPFDKGTAVFLAFQKGKEWSRVIAGFGTLTIAVLYLLDFFSAPHLNGHGNKASESAQVIELVLDPSVEINAAIPIGLKRNSIEFADNQFKDNYSENVLEKFGIKHEDIKKLLPEEKYIAHMDSLSKRKVHICVIGNKEINRPLTAIARIFFVIAVLCACFYSLIGVDEYPNRPILLTLGLFPIIQWYIYKKLRLTSRSTREAMFELEIAKQIKSNSEVNSVAYAKAQAVIMDILSVRNLIESDKYNYYRAVSASTATVSFFLLILFCIWTYATPNYNWNPKTQDMLSELGIEQKNVQFAIWGGKKNYF